MQTQKAVSFHLLKLVRAIQSLPEFNDFRLVGGSALALQLGHRTSVDIDLFPEKSIDKNQLFSILPAKFRNIRDMIDRGIGVVCHINDIKVDFFYDGGKFIRHPVQKCGIAMASPEDIVAMKLNAITNRAVQKDFYDIAVLTEKFTIREMLRFYREKYFFMDVRGPVEHLIKHDAAAHDQNPVHPLISLTWKEATKKIDQAYNLFISETKSAKQKEIEQRLKKAEEIIAKKKR